MALNLSALKPKKELNFSALKGTFDPISLNTQQFGTQTTTPQFIPQFNKPQQVFRVGEGLTPEQQVKARQVLTGFTPIGTEIKLPFIQKGIIRPQGGVDEFAKSMIELPEKIATSIKQIPNIVSGTVPIKGKSKKLYNVPTYQEDALAINDAIINGDLPLAYGVIPFVQVPIDLAFMGSLISRGAKLLEAGLKVPNASHQAAWEYLGKPKNLQEANQTLKELQMQFHPDRPGGSAQISAQINQAYSLLKTEGIPTQSTLVQRVSGKIAKLNYPVEDILKTPTQTPFVGVKGLLPSEAGTIPTQPFQKPKFAFGLSIEEQPAKKIRDELISTKKSIEYNQTIEKKIGITTRGFDFSVLEKKPEIWGTISRGEITDSFILIKDKEITNQVLESYIAKQQAIEKRKLIKINVPKKDIQPLLNKTREIILEHTKSKDAPDTKNLFPKEINPNIAKIQGYSGESGHVLAILSDGQNQVALNPDKMAFIKKYLPNAEFRLGKDNKSPVQITVGKELKGLIMPIMVDSYPFPIKGQKLTPQSRKKPPIKPVDTSALNVAVSSKENIPQRKSLSKIFTEKGRVLVDSGGEQVIPQSIKESPTPLESPVLKKEVASRVGGVIDKQTKKAERALASVGRKHGHTEEIIDSLKKQGVSQGEIDNIYLEDGLRLVDTVKIKREHNGVLSAVITKKELADIEQSVKTNLTKKWIPTKTAIQKIKEGGRNIKSAALEYYELPQIFFDRTGLRNYFYDPVREAQRNASKMKTEIWKKFHEAGLWKEMGWFTPDHLTLSKTEGENIGRYFLDRQGKGGNKTLEDLSQREKKFVEIFDDFIEESKADFYRVARLNGKEPGAVADYAPLMVSKDWKLSGEIGDMEFVFRRHPAFFSTKQRVEKVPFEMYELDYRRVATTWIDKLAQFIHLGDVGPQIKYLANSEEYKEIVGDEIWKTTNKWLKDTFNPQVLSPTEKVSKIGRVLTSVASLGLNFASVVKQVLSQVPLTIIEKAPPKLRSRFAKDFGISVHDLPSITERKGNVAIMDMQGKIQKIFVGPIAKADRISSQLSLNSLLDKEYKKFLKEGKEVSAETIDNIIKQASDRLDMWYGGMTREQLPRMFRTEIGKLFNMFIMPLTSQLNGFIYSVAKASGFKKAERIAEVLTSALIIAYLEQVITNLDFRWSDKKKMVEDTLVSLIGNIPLLSQIVFAYYTDQPLSPSPVISSFSRLVEKIAKAHEGQAEAGDVAFALAELFGTPKQFRRTFQGYEIVRDGGVVDKNGKLLVPVKGTFEYIRAFLRGKYGTTATQDWIRNIGILSEKREWFVPEVEFLQNGDYERKAELYRSFDKKTQNELYAELSEEQQKKLDKVLERGTRKTGGRMSLESIFGGKTDSSNFININQRRSLESIFK